MKQLRNNKQIHFNNVLFLFIVFFVSTAWAGENKKTLLETRSINQHKIEFYETHEQYDEGEIYNSQVVVQDAASHKELHSHVLDNVLSADHSAIFIQLGAYAITPAQEIVFYSYWGWAGDNSGAYYGFRKQVYAFDARGSFVMKSGVVSIEPNPMAPLFQEIKTTQNFLDKKELIVEEKKECDRLQSLIFAEFQAKLVSHSESKNLESEVRQILKNQITLHTQGWEEDAIMKSFGMRK